MAIDTTILEKHFDAVQAHFPDETITIASTDYACIRGDSVRQSPLQELGIAGDYDMVFLVKKSLFTTVPLPRTFLTHESKNYRIDRVLVTPDNVQVMLFCVGDNQ